MGYFDYFNDVNYVSYVPPEIYPVWLRSKSIPTIKKVIFNPPATIVFWADGTKTIVKCMEGKEFNKWDGLAMAICKKHYGKSFKKEFRKWCGK